jgi:hypothetical protein
VIWGRKRDRASNFGVKGSITMNVVNYGWSRDTTSVSTEIVLENNFFLQEESRA